MQSDPADQGTKTGHPRLWVAGLVLLAVGLGAAFLVLRNGTTAVVPPQPSGTDTSDPVTTRESGAAELLMELTETLTGGTRREALALAAPGSSSARRSMAALYDNVQAIGIDDLELRYVDENAGRLSDAERKALGPHAWVGDVQMEWQVAGYDKRTSQMEVSFTFVDTPDGVAFGAAGGDYGNPAPLWLLDRLAVERSRRSLVMVADKSRLDEYADLADRAVADVKKVLPRWRGKLVVEVPDSQADLDRMLDAKGNAYDSIAAVTTTVDGSLNSSSPVHIMVNPSVFDGLGDRGAQIVMSHEATHVATDAATSSMPMWLLEGFADYVALAHVDLPVSVTASQILADVRKDGPPKALPGPHEFDPANKALGASYEAAWLASRLLAETYGERKLIDFYSAVEGGQPADVAFTRILGTSERAFTGEWRQYLQQLAS